MYKNIVLNLKPSDDMNQSINFDGDVNHSNVSFALNNPLSLKEDGLFCLRSAYVPLTYKNVIAGKNDRFMIKFSPANNTAPDLSVYIVAQIPSGQYDTTTALALAINTVLGGLNATIPASLPEQPEGGLSYAYTGTTVAPLSGDMTCVVSNDANSKGHLLFSIADGVKFTSTSVKTKNDTDVASVAMDGGFQILFGEDDDAVLANAEIKSRPANKILGFSQEYAQSGADGFYSPFPVNRITRGSDAIVNVISPTLANVFFTPYIYIRCDLVSDSIESRPRGSRMSNLLAKIPVKSSGYGDAIFYEPDDGNLFYNIQHTDIQNIRISMTDSEGKLLPLQASSWEIELQFKGIFK